MDISISLCSDPIWCDFRHCHETVWFLLHEPMFLWGHHLPFADPSPPAEISNVALHVYARWWELSSRKEWSQMPSSLLAGQLKRLVILANQLDPFRPECLPQDTPASLKSLNSTKARLRVGWPSWHLPRVYTVLGWFSGSSLVPQLLKNQPAVNLSLSHQPFIL